MNTEFKLICTKRVKQSLSNPSQLQQQQPPVLDLLAAVLWIRNTSFILPEMKNEKKKQLSAFFLLYSAAFCLRYYSLMDRISKKYNSWKSIM